MAEASQGPAKSGARPRRRARKRPDQVIEQIKNWIMDQGLRPGHRLPQEEALIAIFGVSRGTIREALKALEAQGLIRLRTGPGGGAFIGHVSEERAIELLGNYFFSRDVTIKDIYALRKLLEPEMAAGLVGRLDDAHYRRLEDTMSVYSGPPRSIEEERAQRMAELDFHGILADACANPLLSFSCRFLHSLLKNLAVCQRIYATAQPELRRQGRSYQVELLAALREGDAKRVRKVMYDHMREAERLMRERETIIVRRFLNEDA